ncbi:prolyl oligopeptidase family serine peptidase [Bifidobacterium miconisargentati]|uniref:prolyl oligopeptidase family serine peptidase n=1 Tax=Bifidobacterium miconisargentati TaxID=2834437 RepID=UPI001BDCC9E7|nr:prolyl oligopeptidase family serine peptidase [Bifidobacterium miconisargentati]MBW3090274.1 prolyl oligopeptidase family serine peptidase [Bifidobacterium miconisargentati]
MSETTDTNDAIKDFPRRKARTLRFTCGAPRSAKVIADGSRALFLRSDGPEDLVTALWLSWFDADGEHHETKLADPRELLGGKADSEDVPAEERARRERAREGGAGIVGYSVSDAGDRVVFTINGRLFMTEIGEADADGNVTWPDEYFDGTDGSETGATTTPVARTRELAGAWLDEDPDMYAPVLNPRIAPDGTHVLYTTGSYLMLVDIGDWPAEAADGTVVNESGDGIAEVPAGELADGVDVESDAVEEALSEGLYGQDADDEPDGLDGSGVDDEDGPLDDRITAIYGVSVEDEDGNPAENTWKIGLAEFVAGEEMDRYDGFWWSPDSQHVMFESFDTADEPTWYISDPANPEVPAAGRRYPRALTRNADVYLTVISLAFDADDRYVGITANADVDWDREAYEYVAAVNWSEGHDPLLLVQNRRQTRDQVLEVAVAAAEEPETLSAKAVEDWRAALLQEDAETGDGVDAESEMLVPAFGATRVLEEHANDQWIDLVAGTPATTPDGRLVCALNDMDTDTNRLTVDGRPFTPAGWNVREVLHVDDAGVMAVVQREPDTAELPSVWAAAGGEHDARSFDVVLFDYDGSHDGDAVPVTTRPGVWTVSAGPRGMVISGRDMEHAHAHTTHCFTPDTACAGIDDSSFFSGSPLRGELSSEGRLRGAATEELPSVSSADSSPQGGEPKSGRGFSADIANYAAEPGFTPNIRFTRLGEHRLYTAIIAPSADSPYARAEKLPVLMKPYGGPGHQQVVDSQSFYWDAQWWADQGFLVVTADGRGTTGRGPKWDRAIFENMKDVTLADQIEAVRALPEAVAALDETEPVPAPDLDKVCMIGWSYGGFLSALAVLDAPDVFKAACAGAPPTDWTLYDTHYTERYLGLDPEVYAHNGIIQDAPKLERPLMLIHGFADDNVTITHSLRLSRALMAAGRPHTFLPLTGITHMTNDETVAENLLILQRDFLKDALA